MGRKNTTAGDIAEIEREIGKLIGDLETHIGRLNSLTRGGASHAVNETTGYLSEILSETAEHLRNGTHAITDEVTRKGHTALRQLEDEMGQRPLLTLAIAAGIGFLAGKAARRN